MIKDQSDAKLNLLFSKFGPNILSLYSRNVLIFLLPYITFPYLAKVLGIEKFGFVALIGAIIQYCSIIIDFGFDLIVIPMIAKVQQDKENVSKIFSDVISLKVIFFALIFLMFIACVFYVPFLSEHKTFFILSFLVVFGNIFLTPWLYIGLEQMRYIALLNLCSGIVYVALIFIFVRGPQDYLKVPAAALVGSGIAAWISIYFIRYKFHLKYILPKWKSLCSLIKDSYLMCVFQLSNTIYDAFNVLIIGSLMGTKAVGVFALANKMVIFCMELISPILQTIYPHVGRLSHSNPQDALKFVKKITMPLVLINIIIFMLLFFAAPAIMESVFGQEYEGVEVLIRIMAIVPLIVCLSNLFGVQIMLNFGFKKAFMRIIIAAALIYVPILLLFINQLQLTGVAYTVLLVQSFVTLSMFIYLWNLKDRLFSKHV